MFKVMLAVMVFALVGCSANNEIGLISGSLPVDIPSKAILGHSTARTNFGTREVAGAFCFPCSWAIDTKTTGTTPELDSKVVDAINNILPPGSNTPLTITIAYDVLASFSKRLVLKIDWFINGATIKTVVLSKQTFMVTPNTDSPEYLPIFVELAKQSTEDFIEIANGRQPKNSKEDVTTLY